MESVTIPTQFFSGQVRLLLKRCGTLREHLHSLHKLPFELQSHVKELDAILGEAEGKIKELLTDPDFGVGLLLKNQINDYKRYAEILNLLEWSPLALLDNYNDKDHYFYRFTRHLCEDVRYPLPPPLVSAHSREYFYSSPIFNMISVPLCEDRFLLAIPDLVHELGHLFCLQNQDAIPGPFAEILRRHFKEENERVADEASSEAYQRHFHLLEQVWLQRYVVEFSCDMFASYLLGHAYGWSHLRLVLGSETELYRPSFGEVGTHPADEAKMRGILVTLEELGGSAANENISREWGQFKTVLGDMPNDEYGYCYPDALLRQLAQQVISVCRNLNLVPYYEQPNDDQNLASLPQQAWEEFHRNAEGYAEWETEKVEALKSLLS